MTKDNEITVFISSKDSTCAECNAHLGISAWIVLSGKDKAICLDCADLNHLEYLPSGDAALTRRSKKYSKLSAVVLKWSKARNHYERQGILVEAEALEKAEDECIADQELREIRRQKDAIRREELDQKYIENFAKCIREYFPGCPAEVEFKIANHACQKYSGRVGRTETAKNFDKDMIQLAVVAHIRHVYTDYDKLLMKGSDRYDARDAVRENINKTLEQWKA